MADTVLTDESFRVNFLIVGAAKAGTTALAKFLSVHPDVYLAPKKEVGYFSDRHFRNPPDYSEYHAHFFDESQGFFTPQYRRDFGGGELPESARAASKRSFTAIGEATPMYMWWNQAPERIWRYNPKMKLIFLLRNPVDRAYSNHQMLTKGGLERLPFVPALMAEPVRKFFHRGQQRGKAYIGRSLYMPQIRRMLEYFPREQMLFLKNEDLQCFHEETLRKVYDFLEVPHFAVEPEVVHSRQYKSMPENVRKWAWKKFSADVEELEQFLGWDCSAWRP